MHQLHLPFSTVSRLVGLASKHSAGDGIYPAALLAQLNGLPAAVQSLLAGLAPNHRVRLHQRGVVTPEGGTFYVDPSCRPDDVDPDHFAAEEPGACYVVKAGEIKEAVGEDYVADALVRVRYADGSTAMVYTAQTHECRLTAAWDVQDWRTKQGGGQEVASNG